jgi:hypothetical protein
MKQKVFKYTGNGDFIPGVPARDITEGEAKSRGVLNLVELSPMYVLAQEDLEKETGENK